MSEFFSIFSDVAGIILFGITVVVFTTYLTLMVYSAIALRKYMRKNSYVDYNDIITSPLAPSVSVIVPAFNESINIVDNIRTLLSLYYNNFEIVVINDGSTDDTLEKVIEAYELEKVNYYFDYRLPCERVRGVYKSANRSYKHLIFVDKRNGGKADALNAGLNVVRNDLFVSIDADSIIEQDALMKLVKPFLEEKKKKVIAAGGVIRIANSCKISGGRIREVRLPKKWLPRAQVMEYTRSFLLGRIAWSELDGLLLISGAMGMFDREIVIQAGGYSTETVGEDMEIVVRIRRYMAERDRPYHVEYIPDPLCWTEVPSTFRSMARQRSRWTRGTMETLYTHRKIFLNKKYGKLGVLGYPYWMFFEWLAPILEFIGILTFIVLAIIGKLNIPFFFLLLGFVILFVISLSIWAVLFEEITFHKYKKRSDVMKLILTAILEPFLFHPLVLLMSIKGNIDKILNKTSWGTQERRGFSQAAHKRIRWDRVGANLRRRALPAGISFAAIAAVLLTWILLKEKPLPDPRLSQKTPPKTEIVTETETETETTETETTETETVTETTYHIVLGSFTSETNAREQAEKLQQSGYKPQCIASDEYTRVAIHSGNTWEKALEELNRIRDETGLQRAWIWKTAEADLIP